MNQNWPLKNSNCCIFKITHWKQLIFEYVKLEVYRVSWPKGEWAGPTHMGHTPTLKMVLLQYKIGQPVWLLSTTVIKPILSRNFWQKSVRVNLRNFHTVQCTVWKLWEFTLTHFWQTFCESNGFTLWKSTKKTITLKNFSWNERFSKNVDLTEKMLIFP